jgi:ABC-type transport system involved in cytochrome c biogenesis permease component
VFFAVSAVLVFSFAFVKEGEPLEDAASGILWIAVAFSGTLALGRTFERERYAETLRALLLAPLLVTGTTGFACVGTLFAAMLVRARSRDVLLPILLYPITIPVIIAGVRGTSALLASPPDEATAVMWIGILTAFDVVFVTLALWTFEPLMTD